MSDPLDELLSEFAEVTAGARMPRPALHRRRSYVLARAFAGALVVILVAAVALVVLATRAPQGPAASAAVSRSGDFQLTLTTDSTVYTPGQAINAVADLAYVGNSPSVEISSLGPAPIGFGIREIGGSISTEPGWELMCIPVDLTPDQPIVQPFTRSGGWSDSDPNRDFLAWFFQDPELQLPSGTWEIYAKVDAGPNGGDCQGKIELQASVTITVLPGSPLPIPSLPTPFPPGVPTPPPVPLSTPTASSAWLACSAVVGTVPYLGGQPVLVQALDVSREQLANYIYVYNADLYADTAWRYPGTTTACWFDGALQIDDPGGGTAARVLVIVDAGEAQLVAVARTDPSHLPLIDPATVPPQTGVTPSPTTPAASPSPAATPAIKVAGDGTQWYELNEPTLSFAPIDTISVNDGHFVALGHGCAGTCLLASEDGLSWSELGTIATSPAAIIKVIHADGLWIAVGDVGGGAGGGLWTSSDGASWKWAGDQPAFQHADCLDGEVASAYIYELYAAENVIVAEGEDRCGTNRGDPATWQSADGLTWERVDAPQMFEVAKSDGVYAGYDENAAIRHAADGLGWSDPLDLTNYDIAPIATGFVGVTMSYPGMSPHRVITSSDGVIWTSQKNDLGTAWTDDLESDGSRAVLLEESDSPLQPGYAWVSSTDGAGWMRVELPSGREGPYPQSIAIIGNRVVVLGTEADTNTPVVWVTEVP